MFGLFLTISCSFIAPFMPIILSASHIIFMENGSIEEVEDSPYLVKQPHSLDDFLKQVEWVQELAELKASIRQQQDLIEQRYDNDDPDIEQKIRENDKDCIRSQEMDLQPEYFQTEYSINLVLIKETIDEGNAMVQPRPIIELFEDAIKDERNKLDEGEELIEPDCGALFDTEKQIIEQVEFEIGDIQDVQEPGLMRRITDEEFQRLAKFLSKRFFHENKLIREINLYMAHFYWRFRGKTRNSMKCLLTYMQVNQAELILISSKFQLGVIFLRLGHYRKAIELLEHVNQNIENCAICLLPLGDAYILSNNLAEAEKVYDRAYELGQGHPDMEWALKKGSVIRCTQRLVDVMERQHKNLLETIDDVANFKARMRRIDKLEERIEENRAPAEARLQAKLVYEHYEYGPLPYANCKEAISWVGQGKRRKRLYCTVTSWNKYSESLELRKKEKEAQRGKEDAKMKPAMEKKKLEREERWKAKEVEEEQQAIELDKYLTRLAPFVGMTMDEPQLRPKYPLERKSVSRGLAFLHPTWPSLNECHRAKNAGEFTQGNHKLPQLFISPQNKGYVVPELLTKFLALGPGEMTPLPWELPLCSAYASDNELSRKFEFIGKLDSFKRLKSGQEPSINFQMERQLNEELFKLVEFKARLIQQRPLLSEIGQRIGNLMKFNIGPKWLSFNLAALYFRLFGIPSEALACIDAALKCQAHQDIALSQLAQIMMQNIQDQGDRQEMDGIERILSIAMQTGLHEPIPYHLLAIFHSIQGHWALSERLLLQALQLDPDFKPSLSTLLSRKCTERMAVKSRPLMDAFPPVCCWPNEQEIYCFTEWRKTKERRRMRCYRLEAQLDEPFRVDIVYFRCNTPYTGRSYSAPAYAKFIAILLKPGSNLRQQKEEKLIRQLETELIEDWNSKKPSEPPVFPLDYGGYSLERTQQHQRPIWPAGISQDQLVRSWADAEYQPEHAEKAAKGDEAIEPKEEPVVTVKHGGQSTAEIQKQSMVADGAKMALLQNRSEVVYKLDIPLPQTLPIPPEEMIIEGKRHAPLLNKVTLSEICQAQKKKSSQLLEQPVSTWVSPTAKGVKVEDLVDLDATLPSIGAREPECPEPAAISNSASILVDLDALPAYIYRQYLTKFYRSEKALKETFRTIGTSQMDNKVEQVAARLSFAIKSANSADKLHWALGSLSSLYWRVQGDPVNAIKCLRHSLQNSPEKFKDVPLVSLANIYHQAGFLHSALFTLGKALETGQDVVAIHFTLANLYSAIGDFPHALQFYYSTLALQSNFEPAKQRILAIHCLSPKALDD